MSEEKFDSWAIIELFGHSRIAGRVSEQSIGGQSFVRVDVPEMDGQPAFTRFLGGGAVYSMTPVSEQVARLAVQLLGISLAISYVVGLALEEAHHDTEI